VVLTCITVPKISRHKLSLIATNDPGNTEDSKHNLLNAGSANTI